MSNVISVSISTKFLLHLSVLSQLFSVNLSFWLIIWRKHRVVKAKIKVQYLFKHFLHRPYTFPCSNGIYKIALRSADCTSLGLLVVVDHNIFALHNVTCSIALVASFALHNAADAVPIFNSDDTRYFTFQFPSPIVYKFISLMSLAISIPILFYFYKIVYISCTSASTVVSYSNHMSTNSVKNPLPLPLNRDIILYKKPRYY